MSYLQVENRVLPPIEIPSRSPKPNTLNNVSTSIAGAKTITNDNNVLPNAQPLLQTLEHRSCKPICNSNSNTSRSRSSSLDLRVKDNNESNANNCIGEKSDNNLNIGTSLTINSNIETTANRCSGQPKLPTLSNDTKIAISVNCK